MARTTFCGRSRRTAASRVASSSLANGDAIVNRSYIPVNAILETVRAGERIPDPQGVANHFMYTIGSGRGKLEVLVD